MAVSNQQILDFLNANPGMSDADIASNMATYGVTAAQMAEATGTKTADIAERFITQQILAQGTTDQWKGEGKGSAQKNAEDMAKILADTGITDIKQFGKVTQYAPVQEIGKTYNGQQVITTTNDEGQTISYVQEPTGEYQYDYETGQNYPLTKFVPVPADAKLGSVYGEYTDYGGEYGGTYTPVDQSKITFKDGQAVVAVGETFGNKATGQAVANTYSERQTGNAFGGTFEGKGNTGYRVQFAADGSPIFYTTAASSSDIGNLAPLLAIASFIPALAPFAQALNAAIAIDNGDILGGIASLAGVAGLSEVSTGLKVVNAIEKGDAMGIVGALLQNTDLNNLASTTMIADGISFADVGNTLKVIDNLDKGNITGALSTAANMTGSSDIQTAVAGLNIINAAKTGDFTQIVNAAGGLNNTLNAANNVVTQLQNSGLVTGSVNNSGAASFADFKQRLTPTLKFPINLTSL